MAEPPTRSAAASDAEAELDQPGLGELREAVANYTRRRIPGRATLRQDATAGLSVAVANVPDGMANGFLVGVNPIHGLYATAFGPLAGGIAASTQLMVITTTAAASLTASQALGRLRGEARTDALFVLVILTGAVQLLLGVLGLGRLSRFVSFSVTTGFLAGISVQLILSQLPTITGYAAMGQNRVTQTLDLLAHLGEVDPWSFAMALLTLALAILLPRTRLQNFGRLVAIVTPSVLVALLQLESIRIVRDAGEIPRGVPTPDLPSIFDVAFDVLTGALSLAIVILVQGVGVGQSVPNPDGSRSSVSRDFVAQGVANMASGLFRGLPVGGSLSATALNVISGARSRWASIFAGIWMAVIVIGVPGAVSYVAMPALGALLVLAGASSLKPRTLLSILRTGWPSRLAAITTFLATLLLPIQAAVGIGVVLSALLYVNRSATDVTMVELVMHSDGRIEERTPAARLASNDTTVLDIFGHLFYAGARTLEQMLPSPRGAEHPVVILRLRGQSTLGATLIDVLSHYADELEQVGGRLYLSGLSERVHDQLVRTGKLRLTGPVRAYMATPVRGEATGAALADARAWLVNLTNEVTADASGDMGAAPDAPGTRA
jgi:SulP family sulfate permease